MKKLKFKGVFDLSKPVFKVIEATASFQSFWDINQNSLQFIPVPTSWPHVFFIVLF